jgi:GTP cyclohydrolase II
MSSLCSNGTGCVSASFGLRSSAKKRASALDAFVTAEHVAVQRALAEFRGGRPVLFLAGAPFVAMPVDGCDQRLLDEIRLTFNAAPLRLAITARRAWALGIKTEETVTLRLNARSEVGEILSLAASASVTRPLAASPARPAILASIDLAKLAGRLPAVLIAEANSAVPTALVQLKPTAVSAFRKQLIQSVTIAACSLIPLEGVEAAQFVVFRDAIGSSSAALVIGEPDFSKPLLVRLHSACQTGGCLAGGCKSAMAKCMCTKRSSRLASPGPARCKVLAENRSAS